jgi:hypothetical protein
VRANAGHCSMVTRLTAPMAVQHAVRPIAEGL